jgi:hypothetical protein
MGPGDFYTYHDGQPVDTTTFTPGKIAKTYFVAEPRFNITYIPDRRNTFKFAYTRNSQFLHLISSSTASLPTDIWLISTNNIAPEINDQLSTGYYRSITDGSFRFSAELYYKWLHNQIDLKNGADIRANGHI